MTAQVHFIYETTNLINGKKYIGKRSTRNINDGYLGSGTVFKKAVMKYGKENFKRKILCFTETKELNSELEELLVDETIVANPMYYNIATGGQGGSWLVQFVTPEMRKDSGRGHAAWHANMSEVEKTEYTSKITAWMQDEAKKNAASEKLAVWHARLAPAEKEAHFSKCLAWRNDKEKLARAIAKSKAVQTGRTKENHQGVCRGAEKRRGVPLSVESKLSRREAIGDKQTGENNPNSKLTNTEREEIISMFDGGMTKIEIVEKLQGKVGCLAIDRIIRRAAKQGKLLIRIDNLDQKKKLNDVERLDIIALFESGTSRQEIAAKYHGRASYDSILRVIRMR